MPLEITWSAPSTHLKPAPFPHQHIFHPYPLEVQPSPHNPKKHYLNHKSLLAETVGLTKKQGVQILEALVALAYKNAKNSFTIPGLGKIVLVNRKARMGRNPATGATIKIAAKRVVKFRVAKAAKDAILGVKK